MSGGEPLLEPDEGVPEDAASSAGLLTLPSIRDYHPSGDVVEVVSSGFDAWVAFNLLQDLDEVAAHGVEFGRAAVALLDASNGVLDLLEAVLKDRGTG